MTQLSLSDYAALASHLIPAEVDGSVDLSPGALPVPGPAVAGGSLVLVGHALGRGYHDGRADYLCDVVDFFGHPADYEGLGLLILACVLHRAAVVVRLGDGAAVEHLSPADVVLRELVIDYADDEQDFGLVERAVRYGHHPCPVDAQQPLEARRGLEESALPELLWDDGWHHDLDVARGRVVANGFGHPRGAASFAGLLLNYARPDSYRDSAVRLEGHRGSKAVTDASVEMRLQLGHARY